MNILVAGGAGFLGSNLCGRLLEQGHDVYCLDNFSTGNSANVSEFNANNHFKLMVRDSSNDDIPDVKVDQIYYLASPTAPGDYKRLQKETIEANSAGLSKFLKMATEQDARMLFTSTIRVSEETPKDSHHYAYINGKRMGEKICRAWHDIRGTKVRVARLFNTYGPKMRLDDSRVVPQFVMRALKGEPLMVVGGGEQMDSFCYVDDMIDGLIKYMNSDIEFGPVQFGYPEPISIFGLAMLALKITRSESPIKFNGIERSSRELEIKMNRPIPDIAIASKRLGWMPKVSLDEGMRKLADYFTAEMA